MIPIDILLTLGLGWFLVVLVVVLAGLGTRIAAKRARLGERKTRRGGDWD